jgi:UDP-GlcNAc:undecaprenyl-phosphate/decaprenyl-phosphate GlcNAc-1-phosphate transferase
MESASALVAVGALALIVSSAMTPLVLSLSHRRSWYDIPNARKIHTNLIPRLGGIAIFWGFVLAAVLVPLLLPLVFGGSRWLAWEPRLLFPLAGMVLIHGMGLTDDFHNLRAELKFTLQLVAAACVTAGGFLISGVSLPGLGEISFGIASYPLTVLWIVALSNAINLVDGVDGLAGGIAGLTALSLGLIGILSGNLLSAFVALGLLGGVAGFLAFNLPPARIFMGDSGSLFLGFVLAVIPLLGRSAGTSLDQLAGPVTLLAIPVLDTILAIVRRVRAGRAIHSADKEHIHHHLLALGLKDTSLLAIVYTACILFGAAAVAAVFMPKAGGIALLAAVWAAAIAGVIVLNRTSKARLPAS